MESHLVSFDSDRDRLLSDGSNELINVVSFDILETRELNNTVILVAA